MNRLSRKKGRRKVLDDTDEIIKNLQQSLSDNANIIRKQAEELKRKNNLISTFKKLSFATSSNIIGASLPAYDRIEHITNQSVVRTLLDSNKCLESESNSLKDKVKTLENELNNRECVVLSKDLLIKQYQGIIDENKTAFENFKNNKFKKKVKVCQQIEKKCLEAYKWAVRLGRVITKNDISLGKSDATLLEQIQQQLKDKVSVLKMCNLEFAEEDSDCSDADEDRLPQPKKLKDQETQTFELVNNSLIGKDYRKLPTYTNDLGVLSPCLTDEGVGLSPGLSEISLDNSCTHFKDAFHTYGPPDNENIPENEASMIDLLGITGRHSVKDLDYSPLSVQSPVETYSAHQSNSMISLFDPELVTNGKSASEKANDMDSRENRTITEFCSEDHSYAAVQSCDGENEKCQNSISKENNFEVELMENELIEDERLTCKNSINTVDDKQTLSIDASLTASKFDVGEVTSMNSTSPLLNDTIGEFSKEDSLSPPCSSNDSKTMNSSEESCSSTKNIDSNGKSQNQSNMKVLVTSIDTAKNQSCDSSISFDSNYDDSSETNSTSKSETKLTEKEISCIKSNNEAFSSTSTSLCQDKTAEEQSAPCKSIFDTSPEHVNERSKLRNSRSKCLNSPFKSLNFEKVPNDLEQPTTRQSSGKSKNTEEFKHPQFSEGGTNAVCTLNNKNSKTNRKIELVEDKVLHKIMTRMQMKTILKGHAVSPIPPSPIASKQGSSIQMELSMLSSSDESSNSVITGQFDVGNSIQREKRPRPTKEHDSDRSRDSTSRHLKGKYMAPAASGDVTENSVCGSTNTLDCNSKEPESVVCFNKHSKKRFSVVPNHKVESNEPKRCMEAVKGSSGFSKLSPKQAKTCDDPSDEISTVKSATCNRCDKIEVEQQEIISTSSVGNLQCSSKIDNKFDIGLELSHHRSTLKTSKLSNIIFEPSCSNSLENSYHSTVDQKTCNEVSSSDTNRVQEAEPDFEIFLDEIRGELNVPDCIDKLSDSDSPSETLEMDPSTLKTSKLSNIIFEPSCSNSLENSYHSTEKHQKTCKKHYNFLVNSCDGDDGTDYMKTDTTGNAISFQVNSISLPVPCLDESSLSLFESSSSNKTMEQFNVDDKNLSVGERSEKKTNGNDTIELPPASNDFKLESSSINFETRKPLEGSCIQPEKSLNLFDDISEDCHQSNSLNSGHINDLHDNTHSSQYNEDFSPRSPSPDRMMVDDISVSHDDDYSDGALQIDCQESTQNEDEVNSRGVVKIPSENVGSEITATSVESYCDAHNFNTFCRKEEQRHIPVIGIEQCNGISRTRTSRVSTSFNGAPNLDSSLNVDLTTRVIDECTTASEPIVIEKAPSFNFYSEVSEKDFRSDQCEKRKSENCDLANLEQKKRKVENEENHCFESTSSQETVSGDENHHLIHASTCSTTKEKVRMIPCKNVIKKAYLHHKKYLYKVGAKAELVKSKYDEEFERQNQLAEELFIRIAKASLEEEQPSLEEKGPIQDEKDKKPIRIKNKALIKKEKDSDPGECEYWTCELLETCLENLKCISDEVISEVIIDTLYSDEGLPDLDGAAPLSDLQKKVLTIIYKLCADETHHPTFFECFWTALRKYLIVNKECVEMLRYCNYVRFITILCRALGKLEDMRWFIYDVLYFKKMSGIPMVYTALCMWPTLLPMASPIEEACPLSLCISHVLLNNPFLDPRKKAFYKANKLEHLLKRYYGYAETSSPDVFNKLIEIFNVEGAVEAIALLCKRIGAKWTLSYVVEQSLLTVLQEWKMKKTNDSAVVTAIKILGYILRPFLQGNNNAKLNEVIRIIGSFLNEPEASDEIQAVAAESLCRLSKGNMQVCIELLVNWKPRNGVVPLHLIKQMRAFIARRKPVCWLKVMARNNLMTN